MACEQADKTAFFESGALPETSTNDSFQQLSADMYYCAFSADIHPADLIRLSATWPQLSPLASRAAAWLHGGQPALHLHANELVNILLSQVLHCTYIGEVAACFLRRVCIDLLLAAAMQNRMAASKRHVRLTPANKVALINIFNQARLDPGLLTDPHHLAAHFNISRYKFLNGFQQEFGITPRDYQQMLVMYHAFHLLLRNGKSLLITAIRCGFETTSCLRSAFIRHFGHDPVHLACMQ